MLSETERQLVAPYVSNLDQPVFGFRQLAPEVIGALFSRYSRSPLDGRELLAREFLGQGEGTPGQARARRFYDRVLLEYGDDSVAELGWTAVAMEGVSNLLAKMIERHRIGLSPLEKSTRYVAFDICDPLGQYRYWRDPRITGVGDSEIYEAACDHLFTLYRELILGLMGHFAGQFAKREGVSDRAYRAALRAHSCDIARSLLPLATQTNMGLVGNARAFENLLYHLKASSLAEAKEFSVLIEEELEAQIPALIARAKTERGEAYTGYYRCLSNALGQAAAEALPAMTTPATPGVELLDWDAHGERRVATALLYEKAHLPWREIETTFTSHPEQIGQVIKQALGPRGSQGQKGHRSHRPPRAFELTSYLFEIVCDIGAFRDLQRHRLLTLLQQSYTVEHRYLVPEEVKAIGRGDDYSRAMDRAAVTYHRIARRLPEEAQYCVPFGFLVRWVIRLNAREAFHLCELRSTVQGHPAYRAIAQAIARKIAAVHPHVGNMGHMTWEGEEELARLAAEIRQDQKGQGG